MSGTLKAGADFLFASEVGSGKPDWLFSTHNLQLCSAIYYFK
jgi:hypothetical protein